MAAAPLTTHSPLATRAPDLAGRIAIVTGSTSGIGLACAKLLAERGAHVVVSGTDSEQAAAVAAQLPTAGISVAGDITSPELPQLVVARAQEEWGRLDILVNNAGYHWDAPLVEMSDEQFDAMLDVHLRAPFRTLRAAARALLRDGPDLPPDLGYRKVVNVSSVAGTMGSVNQANYNAAKAAILGLTKGLAKEWGPAGVNVNAVAPGFIDTRLTAPATTNVRIERAGRRIPIGIPPERRRQGEKMVPLGRMGSPEEVAAAIVFLCSAAADYVHGEILTVSGGLIMGMSS
jgi:3-oxoacyl-[acyl-carrier protein] reductase